MRERDPLALFEELFEPATVPARYADERAELEAVASGVKPLSQLALVRRSSQLTLFERERGALFELIDEYGLYVETVESLTAEMPHDTVVMIDVYVMRDRHQRWRIEALERLRRRDAWWLDEYELEQSRLLGYSERDAQAYLASVRHARPPAFGAVLYGMCATTEWAKGAAVGYRCFHPDSAFAAFRFFAPRSSARIRNDARIPRGHVVFRTTFEPPWPEALSPTTLNQRLAHVLERWIDGAWVPAHVT